MAEGFRIDFKSTGLKKARNMMLALGKMGAAYRGIEMHGRARQREGEKGTNADVKEWLAEGGRDIGPNEEDAKKAAAEYVRVAEQFLRQQVDAKPPSAQAANMASAKAFRKAAMVVQKILADRVDKGEDENGQVKEVTEEYAKWRAGKFDMSDSTGIVLKASGQLLDNLQGSGGLKMIPK